MRQAIHQLAEGEEFSHAPLAPQPGELFVEAFFGSGNSGRPALHRRLVNPIPEAGFRVESPPDLDHGGLKALGFPMPDNALGQLPGVFQGGRGRCGGVLEGFPGPKQESAEEIFRRGRQRGGCPERLLLRFLFTSNSVPQLIKGRIHGIGERRDWQDDRSQPGARGEVHPEAQPGSVFVESRGKRKAKIKVPPGKRLKDRPGMLMPVFHGVGRARAACREGGFEESRQTRAGQHLMPRQGGQSARPVSG